uniref:hypothetical protein n=1 Tax=uncultured Lacinutrix sp. TaxID=574032 RepID=UPI002606C037
YNWNIPNTIDSNTVRVKVSAYYHTENESVSANAFTISPSNHIIVTSPTGGEIYTAGVSQLISWMGAPETSGTYTIQYRTSDSSSWITIASNIFATNYNWTIPNIYSEEVTLRVRDSNNSCIFKNTSHFTILPSEPVLISPNTNVTYYAGEYRPITWETGSIFTSTVRLDYSIDNGNNWINIIASTSNDGNYNWLVPTANSTNCLVRVSSYNFLQFYDVSDVNFTIKPAVTILTPQGDIAATNWRECTVTSITFEHGSRWDDYTIQYSINNGGTWSTINSSWEATQNPATFQWNMGDIETENALVRVYPTGTSATGTYHDVSDSSFAIEESIKVISANYGGILTVGSSYDITWESDGISNFYDISYSIDGGSTFTEIATNYETSSNIYTWIVPNTISSNCIFKIEDNLNPCKSNVSEIPFSIENNSAVITVIAPNTSSIVLNACETYTIAWNETIPIQFYNIHYSLNSGNTWIPIVTNYQATLNEYDWTIPNVSNENVILRVSSFVDSNNFDVTDYSFKIQGETLNAITIENSSQTDICIGDNVSFTAIPLDPDDVLQYQWKINGENVGTDTNSFSSNTLVAGDTITCEIAVSYNCFSETSITSNGITINTVTPIETPTVTISGVDQGIICDFASTTLTANVTSGGVSPSYQWKVNNVNVGSDNPQFSTTDLEVGDVIICEVTSYFECVSVQTVTSNEITITTISPGVPSIPENLSGAVIVPQGTSETYIIDPVLGATSYEWRLTNNGWTESTLTNEVTIPNIMESGTLYVSAVNECGSSIEESLYIRTSPPLELSLTLKVFLQGAALNPNIGEESLMRDDIRIAGLIPTTSPYMDMITCDAAVFNITGDNAIVDWIWVELRDATTNTTILSSQSALLQRDGDVVGVDGISSLTFSQAPNNYYIVLKHRNHLGIMTTTPITLSSVNTIVDFTDANNQITFGTDAQTTFGMSSGIVAMWSGDVNEDGQLNYSGGQSDAPGIRSKVFNDPNNSVFGGPPVASYQSVGYNTTDIDMDGLTVYSGGASDVLHIRNNIFNNPSNSVFGGPPTGTYLFIQQLPEGGN